jgi:probable HAF family extracellular repeat protein
MQDLGTLGGSESAAYGVSADGAVVVGSAQNAARYWHAFRWTASGGMQDLGTLGGMRARLMVFPPMAPWWSAGLTTPQGRGVPFAGRLLVGCKTSARWAAGRAWLMVFPPTAPWWSAGLKTPHGQRRAFRWTVDGGMQDLGTLPGGCCSEAYGVSADGAVVVGRAERRMAVACLSLDGGWWDARPRHAGRLSERGLWCFRRWRRGGRLVLQRRRAGACLSLDGGWWDARPRHAAGRRGSYGLMVFPPTAPWWSAGLTTPQGRGVPFAGRWMVGCKTSARWAARES